jgi:hypothetical protein
MSSRILTVLCDSSGGALVVEPFTGNPDASRTIASFDDWRDAELFVEAVRRDEEAAMIGEALTMRRPLA